MTEQKIKCPEGKIQIYFLHSRGSCPIDLKFEKEQEESQDGACKK
jgi:hypothetical protein